MPFRFLDHTGDVGVEIEAPSLAELFGEALVAFTTTVTDLDGVHERETKTLELAAPAPDLLLLVWLEELHYELEVGGRIYRRAEIEVAKRGEEWALAATLHGERWSAESQPLNLLIKGITYHELEVRELADGTWRARVILDI